MGLYLFWQIIVIEKRLFYYVIGVAVSNRELNISWLIGYLYLRVLDEDLKGLLDHGRIRYERWLTSSS